MNVLLNGFKRIDKSIATASGHYVCFIIRHLPKLQIQ